MKSPLLLLTVLFALAVTGGASTLPPEKLLPADTLGVITVPDFAKARSASAQWPASQLWQDAAMKPFKEKFITKLKSDLLTPLERELGIKCSDYAGLAQGQLTLAVTRNGWEGRSDPSPGFLVLMDTKDKSDVLKTNLASLKQKWVDSGKQLKTEKIRDVDFTILILSSGDLSKALEKVFPDPNAGNETLDGPKPQKAGRKLEWLVGQSGSLLILGTSAKDIEKALLLQSGGSVPSLSEQSSFAASHAALFRDALSYGWINLKTIVETLAKKKSKGDEPPPDADLAAPSTDKLLSALGVTGLQTLSFHLRDSSDGCLFDVRLNVPESQRKGVFKILSYDAKDAYPPPFVPADAVKFARWRLDMAKAWATLESTLNEVNPSIAGVVKLMVDSTGKDKDPNFDLRKNLFANLGDDLISYEKLPRKQTLTDLNTPPSLFLLNSPNPEQLASAFKAVGSVMSQPGKLKEREFLGRKVYSMNIMSPLASGASKGQENTLHYAASGGYVAMSSDVAMLEEYLRSNPSKSLRELPGLADAAQKVGGMGTGLFGFENQSETMRSTLEILKKESGTLSSLFSDSPLAGRLGVNQGDKVFKEWVDLSLLPPFDKVSKYFYLSVWAGSVNTDGLSYKLFAPTPPQLRK